MFASGTKLIDIFPNNMQLQAIVWRQPYGGLMFYGKDHETRSWPTNYRGWVLICAGKRDYDWGEILEISGRTQTERILDMAQKNKAFRVDSTLRGKAIGIAYLYDCQPMLMGQPQDYYDKAFVDYAGIKYIHFYKNQQLIEPFDWKGSLGFKKVPYELRSKIIFK